MSSNWVLDLNDITQATACAVLSTVHEECYGVSIDSRKDIEGCLFFAIKGAKFDAHEFLDQVVEKGARILIVEREPENLEELGKKATILKVKNTTRALQEIARFWRRKTMVRVVGITGSNGKTTAKDFAAQITSTKFKVCSTQGNLNNHWGVPLTLLSIQPTDDVAIVEMGMNHVGEIAVLTRIAEPDIVVVTNVGSSHVGEVGSLAKIRQGKREIYEHAPDATAIFNLDNEHTANMYSDYCKQHPDKKPLTYTSYDENNDADINMVVSHLSMVSLEVQGRIKSTKSNASLRILGRHNVYGLMTAAAIGLALGMSSKDIWAALPNCKTQWGRNQLVLLESGAKVVFDGYNANPQSMEAMIKSFFELDLKNSKKYAILGEMLELGDKTDEYHRQIGHLVARAGVDYVWFIGPSKKAFMKGLKSGGFNKTLVISDGYEESLATEIHSMLEPGDIVAIKGSRGIKLERVLEKWDTINFDPVQK